MPNESFSRDSGLGIRDSGQNKCLFCFFRTPNPEPRTPLCSDSQQTLLAMASRRIKLGHMGLRKREGACLVEDNRIDLAKQLKGTTVPSASSGHALTRIPCCEAKLRKFSTERGVVVMIRRCGCALMMADAPYEPIKG